METGHKNAEPPQGPWDELGGQYAVLGQDRSHAVGWQLGPSEFGALKRFLTAKR